MRMGAQCRDRVVCVEVGVVVEVEVVGVVERGQFEFDASVYCCAC